jgi:outer membrane protein
MLSTTAPIRRRGPTAILAAAALALVAAIAAPSVLAAEFTDVGYVDQAKLASIKSFNDANRQLAVYKAGLDKQFAQRMRGIKNPADQQRIAQEFQGKLAAKQRDVLAPLFTKAQVAIASVASRKNLSIIVDKQIIIVGGQDVTDAVIDLLNGVGEPVPPVNTPPPSSIGYVDQTQIDVVPKMKSANDEFAKFRADQQQQAQAKMKSAKTDVDRQAVITAMQKALTDKQKQLIDPLVEQTRGVIADVAKKKNLVLVIDKINRIYGGTDITSDVTSALK